MNKMLVPILFAIGTAVFWGCYGPTIGNAHAPRVDGVPLWSPFKPYVFIGLAYLVIAICGGLAMMAVKGDSFSFTGQYYPTMKWGFLAGLLGAFGALCLTSAMMTSRGNALLVMPIVFGGAVSVSAIVSMLKLHAETTVSPMLWVGMALTIVGLVIVAMNTPQAHAPAKPAAELATPVQATGSDDEGLSSEASDSDPVEESTT
ncbi:hypothetical protein [Allorhodopirellula solitaria]|uniref:Uncharacterized protein n=1 Tax=Allorhodopirellula solitaria TaxID=2527987 RepID=A0A5C5XY73_9BACT|nr:hypothetical protein [Allorhodopirellula solitaria]TWT67519.1 hypothetical protein CA85_23700 [Allorhodopirellula solitaria]